jgi:cell division protein FtsB
MRAKEMQQGMTIGLLLLVAFWLGSSIWGLVEKAQIAVSQANETKAEYQSLQERKTTLEANLAAINTPEGQDAAIRLAFGVARPGEEVIVVVPPAPAATTTPSWWQRVLGWF